MFRPLALLSVLSLACSAPPPAFCDGSTSFPWDPARGETLAAFPDDVYTVPDGATLTGLRVKVDETNAPWLSVMSPPVAGMYADLNTLDGFGTNAGIALRFSGPLGALPTGDRASLTSDAVLLVEVGDEGAVRIPFETRLADNGATALLWPMRPLRPKTRHAVVVTTKQQDASGGCIAPSAPLRAVLSGKDVPAALSLLVPRFAEVLSRLALQPGEVSAAAVFTTQSIEEESVAVARDVASRSFAWKERPTCTRRGNDAYRACEGSFVAGSYVSEGRPVDGTVQSTYELKVSLWLPFEKEGPFPVLVFGHGLNDRRESGASLARIGAEFGLAVIAIDAVSHGVHPTADPDASVVTRVLGFFGITLQTAEIHPLRLRDNFRASAWDKLQLLQLVAQAPDVDGDGTADFDPSRIGYSGLSLGGIMGAELLALSDRLEAATLTVPGGRIASIVSDSPLFALALEALRGPGMTDGDMASAVALLQTLVERGDAANYAAHVLRDRFPAAGPRAPHLLFNEVIDDDTVVNASNHALARAFGLPQLPPVALPVGVIDVLEGGPVRANLADERTAAMFQFDRLTFGAGGAAEKATHQDVWHSRENLAQLRRFLQTWVESGTPEIVDPYLVLGTPPLAP